MIVHWMKVDIQMRKVSTGFICQLPISLLVAATGAIVRLFIISTLTFDSIWLLRLLSVGWWCLYWLNCELIGILSLSLEGLFEWKGHG